MYCTVGWGDFKQKLGHVWGNVHKYRVFQIFFFTLKVAYLPCGENLTLLIVLHKKYFSHWVIQKMDSEIISVKG